MKRIIGLLALLSAYAASAQHREIDFAHDNLPALMEKAKTTGKMIFVDCYTTWCGPCKYMSKEVFTQDSIADFFNSHFINLKMDMEKGEGPAINTRYDVGAYPTFLLLDGDGNLVYKFVGGMEAGPFMEKIREGMDPANRIAEMLRRYKEGDRSRQLMRDYILEALKMKEIARGKELAHEYFSMLDRKERAGKENWFMFGENNYSRELSDIHSEHFNYLLEHWKDFAAVQGKDVVDKKISGVFRKLAGYCLRGYYQKSFTWNKAAFDRYRQLINGTQTPDKKDLLVMMDIAQAACERDSIKVLDLMADNIAGFDSRNMDITFDLLSMFPAYKRKAAPRWMEIMQAVAAHSKNPHLVSHVKTYL